MVVPAQLLDFFESIGVSFYAGVPDSQLQSFCIELFQRFGVSNKKHLVAANEGNAVALGAGYHLATGKIPLVYMQNSGLGNAINPIVSLTDPAVYNIPILYMVGWRGEPGIHDEPQHIKQGEITCSLLDLMGIPYIVIDKNSTATSVIEEFKLVLEPSLHTGRSGAIIVKKGAFEKTTETFEKQSGSLSRESVIREIAKFVQKNDFIIATTGKISRELYEFRDTTKSPLIDHDFLTVGSMGHASSLALSIALQHPDKNIWCIDGDGAALMHMGSMATTGSLKPKNYIHVILNNGSHESVGGMPTVAREIDFLKIGEAVGYSSTYQIREKEELVDFLKAITNKEMDGPIMVEIIVASGSRPELIRPKSTPNDNKLAFMTTLQEK